MLDWKKNQDSTICCIQETKYNLTQTNKFKVKGWKGICHTYPKQRQTGLSILLSDRGDVRINNITGMETIL